MMKGRLAQFGLIFMSIAFFSACQGRADQVRQRKAQERQENQRQLTQALRESHEIVYQTNVSLRGVMRRDDLARPLTPGRNTVQLSSDEYDELYVVLPYLDSSTTWNIRVEYEVELWEGQVRQRTQEISRHGMDCELLLQLGRELQDQDFVEVTITVTDPPQFGINPFLYSKCPFSSEEQGAAMILRRNQ